MDRNFINPLHSFPIMTLSFLFYFIKHFLADRFIIVNDRRIYVTTPDIIIITDTTYVFNGYLCYLKIYLWICDTMLEIFDVCKPFNN